MHNPNTNTTLNLLTYFYNTIRINKKTRPFTLFFLSIFILVFTLTSPLTATYPSTSTTYSATLLLSNVIMQQKITPLVLFGDVIFRNGIFWTIGEQSHFYYYPIIYYQRIKVYRVGSIDMELSHCNNGVSGTALTSISTMVLIVQDKIIWQDSYYNLCS